jgi:hypothetical protein
MQQTALRTREIVAFLKVRIGSMPVPIYPCAAAEAQAVRRLHALAFYRAIGV